MSPAARSILVFGVYIVVLGVSLVIAPHLVLGVMGLPAPREVWIRVLGMVGVVLGYYYVQAAREDVQAFFRWSIWGRSAIFLGFALLVIVGVAPAPLALFGVADAVGAAWTAGVMRPRGSAS